MSHIFFDPCNHIDQMISNPNKAWNDCLNDIEKEISKQSFKTWFLPIKPIKFQHNILTIQVPNKFFFEWIEEHHIDLLKKVLNKNLGDNSRLEYQIPVVNDEPNLSADSIPNNIKNPFVIPGIKRRDLSSNLNPKYTLDNFVEGDCNRLARSAGLAIARKPGETAFNPLVIYGDVGLGKTHLLQAIGNEIEKNHPKKKVVYVSSEEFTNQIIKSIKDNNIEQVVNFYQMIDALLIDDIQFLANKTKTQEIFFHIFNQLHQNRKQLVITSDRPPKDLNGMEDRLISRFKWGLTADLQKPEFETRMAIIDKKIEGENIEIPFHVSEYLCYNIETNIRELEGALVSIVAQSRLNRRELDLELAKEVVAKFVERKEKELNLDSILTLVAEHFSLDADIIRGKSRKREVVIARQLTMFLAKKHTNYSLKQIGSDLGGRDHSTVIYSCRAVQDMLDTNEEFKKNFEALDKKLVMTMDAIM